MIVRVIPYHKSTTSERPQHVAPPLGPTIILVEVGDPY